MRRVITEKTFYQYLKCPTWVYLDVHGDRSQPHTPLMQLLQDDGMIEEKHRDLLADRQDVAEVTAEDPAIAYEQTLTFMREGRATIYRGVLMNGHWVGHPDILEKVEGRSELGFHYYVACDIKRAHSVRDEHKFQGCFYAELLHRIQGVKPVQGYVLTHEKEALSYLIEEFESTYKLTLEEIEKIMAGQRPGHFLSSRCKQSPWFKTCRDLSESCGDLSLLNRVWQEEVRRLEGVGVTTIDKLASVPFKDLREWAPDLSDERLQILHDQAVALKNQKVIIRHPVVLPDAKEELYFDIESDPLRDFDYLFGVLHVKKGKAKFHDFLAKKPGEEEKMWKKFVAFIEKHPKAPIYHYGNFEWQVVQRFAVKYGISEDACEALEKNMIDLLTHIRPAVLFPLTFYSLKDIATYTGFTWRADDASGANSVLWFEEWLKTQDKELLQKILEYNEDDVRATWHVREWLKANAQVLG